MKPNTLNKRQYMLAGFSVVAVLLVEMVLSACQQQTVSGPQSVPVAETQPQILPSPVATGSPTAAPGGRVAYRVVQVNDGSHLEQVALPGESKGEPAVDALNSMAALKDSPLPKGTRALGVTFNNDLATVNFNKAFANNFEGGDEREALMFNAITATLGQFPKVKRVQILVDGEKVPVGGTQDTTEPLDVPPSITQVSQRGTDSETGAQ